MHFPVCLEALKTCRKGVRMLYVHHEKCMKHESVHFL